MHTEYSIQKLLVHKYRDGARYLVPNLYYRLGEMDLFMLRRNGYAEEFEIKLTTSDLMADVKKLGKHAWLLNVSGGKWSFGNMLTPNKFSYVVGPNVSIVFDRLPKFAGIYRVHDNYLECLRTPKFIHKQKLNWDRNVAGSCSGRLLYAYKYFTL